MIKKISQALIIRQLSRFSSLQKTSKLSTILDKEIQYEQDSYKQDPAVHDFLKTHKFQLKDIENDQNVELHKKQGDLDITVCFQSRTPSQPEEEEENALQEETEQNEDVADFTVYLKKNDKILAYECQVMNGEMTIAAISTVKDLETHKKSPRFERGLTTYIGPDFQTLDEQLQIQMSNYLKGLGIDSEIAAFVEHYSLDKEQRLYMQWLKDLKNFVN